MRFFRVTEPIRRGENKCGKSEGVVVGVTETPKCKKAEANRPGLVGQVDHHVLELGVIFEGINRLLLPVAGQLR
jgi:hypothetical protein